MISLVDVKKDGVYEVTVLLDGKPYTYVISSEYAVNKFLGAYYKQNYSVAMKTLNRYKEVKR